MSRYFTERKAAYTYDGNYIHDHVPSVPEHVATDTGLLDRNGERIMRAPRPIGFIWGNQP